MTNYRLLPILALATVGFFAAEPKLQAGPITTLTGIEWSGKRGLNNQPGVPALLSGFNLIIQGDAWLRWIGVGPDVPLEGNGSMIMTIALTPGICSGPAATQVCNHALSSGAQNFTGVDGSTFAALFPNLFVSSGGIGNIVTFSVIAGTTTGGSEQAYWGPSVVASASGTGGPIVYDSATGYRPVYLAFNGADLPGDPVPEPGSGWLLGGTGGVLIFFRRRLTALLASRGMHRNIARGVGV